MPVASFSRREAGRAARLPWRLPLLLTCVGAASCDSPTAVGDSEVMVSVAAGGQHTCALADSGRIWCWGRGTEGQLGHLDFADSPAPVPLGAVYGGTGSNGERYVQLDAGARHSCALTIAGAVHCWGWGHNAQLGIGSFSSVPQPIPVAGGARYVQVATGGNHSCAVTDGGEVHCWGENGQGQVGDGTHERRFVPTRVASEQTFSAVSAGMFHTCALATTGEAYCWGLNHVGQLGTGDLEARTEPAPVFGGERFGTLDAGDSHTCGVALSGAALCWGSNAFGELGNGDLQPPGFTGAWAPDPVRTGVAFAAVSVGDGFTCGTATDDRVSCWGRGSEGQLGNGQSLNRTVPMPLDGAFTLREVDAGSRHGCGVSRAGGVYCWGDGTRGQLGTRTISASEQPARVQITRE
jgi:alpha-tubulin suppressor-like RCC1 family protein